MKDFFNAIMGVCTIIVIALILMASGFNIGQNNYKQILDNCESELPRNQNCKLIAVPEENE